MLKYADDDDVGGGGGDDGDGVDDVRRDGDCIEELTLIGRNIVYEYLLLPVVVLNY